MIEGLLWDTCRMKHLLLFVLLTSLSFFTACRISPEQPLQTPTHTAQPEFNPIIHTEPTTSPAPTRLTLNTPTVTSSPAVEKRVSLMAVGDIMLGRTVGEQIESEGITFPFAFTAETLSKADVTIGNLECPISTKGNPQNKAYAFRAPLNAASSLAYGGFDLVSLANNHILDYGPAALEETLKTLTENQIHAVGAGLDDVLAYQPVFMDINGLRLAFLAFLDIPATDYDYPGWEAAPGKSGIAWAHSHRVSEGVKAAKQQSDIVIVLFHNGYEIVQKVSSAQQEIARLAIDNGASLVIGSHPHVLQRIEYYRDGLIAYSMGNFVFDNFLFPPNYSAILVVELTEDGVESYQLIDVVIQLNGIPQVMPYNHDLRP